MRHLPLDYGCLHFVGIGGIGMSGIAEVLHGLGYTVRGSDVAVSGNVERLQAQGIDVSIGHRAENIDGAAVIVVSSAIKADNPELIAARSQRIPVVRRAEMLAELMRLKNAIAIGGTHGKTTTTSMIGAMLEEGGFDPTVINGGIVNRYGTNVRLGLSDWMVVEADESDGTFTRLPATVAVVTNIDPEHMDHYGSFADVKAAFRQFIENIPFYGYAVLCADHPEVQSLLPELTDRRVVTYGFNPQADVQAVNIKAGADGSTFDLIHGGGEAHGFHLPMAGRHNVQNVLAAIAVGLEMAMPIATIKRAVAGLTGVKRRFTKTGQVGGITVIDDYGHHPVEIRAVLSAARDVVAESKGRVIAVMQPHRYTRLHSLFDEFCTCFNEAETVIIADVYPAGEAPIDGANRDALAQGIRECGHRDVRVLETPNDLAAMVLDIATAGDLVVCLGAGDITKWAYALPGGLETFLNRQNKRA
jgi:UDP-N-acetylmuramate--alanine ligase